MEPDSDLGCLTVLGAVAGAVIFSAFAWFITDSTNLTLAAAGVGLVLGILFIRIEFFRDVVRTIHDVFH